MERGIIAPRGVRCCRNHLENGFLKNTDHVLDKRIQKEAHMTPCDLENLLKELRTALAKNMSGLNFDEDDNRLSNQDYYNLTGS